MEEEVVGGGRGKGNEKRKILRPCLRADAEKKTRLFRAAGTKKGSGKRGKRLTYGQRMKRLRARQVMVV